MHFFKRILTFATLAFLSLVPLTAQQPPAVQGDFNGAIGPLTLKLHLKVGADGKLTGTLDSPNQGANGIAVANIVIDGKTLSYDVPLVGGNWKGTIEDNGAKLTGTWNQGASTPLTFTKDTFVAASKPSAVDGIWLGTLGAGPQAIRGQLTVKSDQSGKEYCALDSLDQGISGLECSNVAFSGNDFSFDIPAVRGRYTGKLSADGKSLDGTWNQGTPQPLRFERQAAPSAAPAPKPAVFDPAIAPVKAAEMEAVLRKDFEKALTSGLLAPETQAGITIGIVRDGERRVFSLGTAKVDSIFEIGSITKTFTGLMLAQMVTQGNVKLDTPVRELLPAGTVTKPAGAEITLFDLVTQHSGLPRMPDNFNPKDPQNPYADYAPANLYQFMGKQGVAKPANAPFLYSNLGVGLLGQALANQAKTTYPALIKRVVIDPLGLKDTVVSLSPAQERRFIQGHGGAKPFPPAGRWDIDALAGAGAIRSTAGDMLTYVEANLHPEKVRALTKALTQSHEIRADVGPGTKIAFAWLYDEESGDYWHNGGTGGYSSYCFFNPKGNYAGVVLFNRTVSPRGETLPDLIGDHISQRFAGTKAISIPD
jgi:D-alanyl-D-alanine-carboxypeptidase/D-alanyl-D-alanine-endopeptidase